MHLRRYKYSCIIDTPYSLFLYLLMCEDRDRERTIFFVGDGIADEYLVRLPKVIRFSSDYNDYVTRKQKLKIKLRALFWRWLYINFTELYAQDHLEFSAQLIGRNSYTMIEDAPGSYTTCLNSVVGDVLPIPTHPRPKLRRLVLLGPTYGQFFGRNKYCIDRWVTEENDLQSPILEGRKYKLINICNLWCNASENKKKFIQFVFGVDKKMLEKLKSCKTIIFTEAYSEDDMNLKEAASIYAPYVGKYKADGVVIKPHPRDYMNWKEAFPDVYVMNTRVPMQILNIMGAEFTRAVTVFSTAISAMSPETEIIWLGAKAHPKLLAKYGMGGNCPFEKKFKNIIYA